MKLSTADQKSRSSNRAIWSVSRKVVRTSSSNARHKEGKEAGGSGEARETGAQEKVSAIR